MSLLRELIIFDFGQVIVRLDWECAFTHWQSSSGVDRDTLASCLTSDEVFLAYERGELADAVFIRHACQKLQMSIDDDAFIAGWNAIFREPYDLTVAAIEKIDRLNGARRVVLLSNTNAIHERYFRRVYADALRHFDALYLSYEMDSRKPEAACFNAVLAAQGIAAERCYFFDDLAENVAAANALGIRATQVTSPDDVTRVLQTLAS